MNDTTKTMFLIIGFGTFNVLIIISFGSRGAVQGKNAASVWLRAAACGCVRHACSFGGIVRQPALSESGTAAVGCRPQGWRREREAAAGTKPSVVRSRNTNCGCPKQSRPKGGCLHFGDGDVRYSPAASFDLKT